MAVIAYKQGTGEEPSDGEKPLDVAPQYGGRGGSQQAADYYAANDFQQFFGRLPTRSELAMLSSAYMSGDPNVANTSGGRSVVAQYFQNKQNSPEKEYARQQEEYKKGAAQHYGSIDQMFQSAIGRAASDQEKEHFGSLMASGQLNAYQLGQFVNQLPESVKKQDEEFRGKLSGELDTQNQKYFSEKILPAVQQDFLKRGLSPDSSGLASSLALAAQDQSANRENFLTNLSADQYQNQTANARADYQDTLNRYYGNQDYSRDRTNALDDRTYNRINELQDYSIQKQAYDNYLKKYGKRGGTGSTIQGLLGGATSGAMAGFKMGGVPGAIYGGVAGGGLGGWAGSQG